MQVCNLQLVGSLLEDGLQTDLNLTHLGSIIVISAGSSMNDSGTREPFRSWFGEITSLSNEMVEWLSRK